jgi:hypothetical protein
MSEAATVGYIICVGMYVCLSGGLGVYVAIQKRRPLLEGFICGVSMGPLGAILVACLPTLAPRPPAEEADDPEH